MSEPRIGATRKCSQCDGRQRLNTTGRYYAGGPYTTEWRCNKRGHRDNGPLIEIPPPPVHVPPDFGKLPAEHMLFMAHGSTWQTEAGDPPACFDEARSVIGRIAVCYIGRDAMNALAGHPCVVREFRITRRNAVYGISMERRDCESALVRLAEVLRLGEIRLSSSMFDDVLLISTAMPNPKTDQMYRIMHVVDIHPDKWQPAYLGEKVP